VLLGVKDLHALYGASHVLHGVSLEIEAGEIVCLLGRNGVGKTTCLRSLIGLLPARAGAVVYRGQDITKLPAHQRARLGLGYVPQGREIFPELSVEENLRLGAMARGPTGRVGYEEVLRVFPALQSRLRQRGGTLSGGQQQMLAIARGLIAGPQLLLLDEPTEGIQPSMILEIRDVLRRINLERGVSLLLVEQHLDFARSLAARYYVMERGQIVRAGRITELSDDIVSRYLSV
jgi:urea transport system ATP-binding protein